MGLFAPPLLAATADAATEEPADTRAVQRSAGEAEGSHVEALKGAIEDAQKKMAERAGKG